MFFSKAKTVECDKKVRNNFDQCGITIPCSATYFLKVGARGYEPGSIPRGDYTIVVRNK